MNKLELEELSFLKYRDGKVFFEDKWKYAEDRKSYINSINSAVPHRQTIMNKKLSDEKLKKVLVNLTIDTEIYGQTSSIISNKVEINLNLLFWIAKNKILWNLKQFRNLL